ncbi:hypothetical protein AGMMS49942_21300 [Spirochaetia bacterium]|nr:hypothetical protein AGMMS49942_21300 [Spirochaetia bacterium]
MNFNRIFNSINQKSVKNDTDVLKTRNYDDNNAKNKRIYQVSNTDGKKSIRKLRTNTDTFHNNNHLFKTSST